jgi:hypothetical protein
VHRKNCMKTVTVMNFWVPYNQATSGSHTTRKLLGSIQPGKLFLNCLSDCQFLSNSLYHKCWLLMQKLCSRLCLNFQGVQCHNPPRWCLHLIVVRRFACPRDPACYAGGSVATGRVSQAGQDKGEGSDYERDPGPPG